LKGDLSSTLSGFIPLAFTAARKSERMLAKRLAVKPNAAGLTAASRALIAPISRGMAAGSFPNKIAIRLVPDFRSRSRVPESPLTRSRAANTSAKVTGSAVGAACVGVLRLGLLVMGDHLSGFSGSGLAWSREDKQGQQWKFGKPIIA